MRNLLLLSLLEGDKARNELRHIKRILRTQEAPMGRVLSLFLSSVWAEKAVYVSLPSVRDLW